MISTPILGAIYALAASAVWGCSDFSGGQAARRNSPYQVLVIASTSGIAVLLILALARGEGWPSGREALFAFLAGIAGAFGIATLYEGLALGAAALVSPIAAVVGTIIPVLVGMFSGEPASGRQFVGFLCAAAGIWLAMSASIGRPHVSRRGVFLSLLAGIGFGFFFVLLPQSGTVNLFSPLVIAKGSSLGLAAAIVALKREGKFAVKHNPIAFLAGLLDAGGNSLYLLATSYTRMDVAAVLASLYPVGTVLLARWLDGEKVSKGQWLGVILCMAAVVLIVAG